MDQEETAITTITASEKAVIPVGEASKGLEVENSIVLEDTIQIVTMVYVR